MEKMNKYGNIKNKLNILHLKFCKIKRNKTSKRQKYKPFTN